LYDCDVVVVGGGLIGCAAAYYLAGLGQRVTVVEAGQIGAGASGRNAGSLHFQLEFRLLQHQEQLGAQIAHLVPLTKRAIEHWRGLEAELSEDLELVMHGGLMVAETHEQREVLIRKCEFENRLGMELELIEGSRLRAMAPYLADSVIAALHCADEGHCNPRYLTLAFWRNAEARGARLLPDTRVVDNYWNGDAWELELVSSESPGDRISLRAGAVLNAGGAWAAELAQLAGVHLPLFPVGLAMHLTEEAPPFIDHMIQHVGKRLSMKQVREGNVLMGGGWSAYLPALSGSGSRSAQARFSSLRGNLRTAASVVPAVRDLYLLRSWTGVTGVTADQLPLLGPVPQLPRYFVAAGGSGFTFGPIYAQLIAETIVHGESSYPITPYSPARFSHINMFMQEVSV
jgi:sarcosine oxidase subunit beta